ncbi:sensor domain-containing diguanylate cyclase [Nitrincola iocasae]|uniref:diguanylate cyclase n=1 Tax=Nitrincola iocasae TaxID=2614693 RepID=A0A5J6LD65_9GAMM|nr:sensor domain-containing diguanylate cyclase [Nitrincola iocasae]QEW06191.1 sensor domain-containing diguanylate cyclase [Nitrincola iocasae]
MQPDLTLAEENRELRQRVSILHHKAERNEQLLRAFFSAELDLLSCITLAELLDYLLNHFRQDFNLSAVTLMLLDPEDMVQELLDGSARFNHFPGLQLIRQQQPLRDLYPDSSLFCGEATPHIITTCFRGAEDVQSCALLPLIREDCLIGSLCLGSSDPGRYSHLLRYDYVSHLASVVAVCMENAISRETLQRLSSIDPLTRALNRRALSQQLLREIKRCNRTGEPLGCILLDIDHFKPVNDTHGHLSGDKVLRDISQLLKEQLRETDSIARYGGEEFAILLPGCPEPEATRVAENLRKCISQTLFSGHQNQALRITASLGITICEQQHTVDADVSELTESLIQTADQALYFCKHNGRNRVSFMPCLLKVSAQQ